MLGQDQSKKEIFPTIAYHNFLLWYLLQMIIKILYRCKSSNEMQFSGELDQSQHSL